MTIHLYAMTWNERVMLPFFFRHYDRFVDRYFIFDDGSDDGTVELLKGRGNVEVQPLNYSQPETYLGSQKDFMNSIWKRSRGKSDWVIIADIDEHLYHPRLLSYLSAAKAAGVTMIPSYGFDMVSEEFPAEDELLEVTRTRGAPDQMYNKLRIFDPNAFSEMQFSLGGHMALPQGRIVLPETDEMVLLHYRHLGRENFLKRFRALATRQRAGDLAKGWLAHWKAEEERLRKRFAEKLAQTVDAVAPDAPASHSEHRWWRAKTLFQAGATLRDVRLE